MANSIDGLSDDDIRNLLLAARTIAIIGASADPARPSFRVAQALAGNGYTVVPVNPGIAGQTIPIRPLAGADVVATLAECRYRVDMVDIFRNSAAAGGVVDDAISLKAQLGIKTVWMQLGVINEAAAVRARDAGLCVVMDRCPVIEIARLGLEKQIAQRSLSPRARGPATARRQPKEQ